MRGIGRKGRTILVALMLIPALASGLASSTDKVKILRVPDGGLQPQVALDEKGIVHLLYFKGDPQSGDLYYTRSTNGGAGFSSAIRVNSQPGSAIAVGNVRGAHLAIGRQGRVHVAWMGSKQAQPKGPSDATPMLYARLSEAGTAFEPQRNVMQFARGLDGGGSVAADGQGHVYVAWHANPHAHGEDARQVFVAHSTDGGQTFARERPAFAQNTGACACCGMRAFADRKGNLYMLYRSAEARVNRDMYALFSKDHGASFQGADIHPWKINHCVMSTSALVEGPEGVLAVWETEEQIYFAKLDATSGQAKAPVAAPGQAIGRKHPALAVSRSGETLLVWTEGMGWKRGGSVHWQLFDARGQPTAEKGQADGVPAHSLVASFARPDGGFTVVY